MDQKTAESIQRRVEEADALFEKLHEIMDSAKDSAKGCDAAVRELLPFMLENPLFDYGWQKLGVFASSGTEKNLLNVDQAELALRWAAFLNSDWAEPLLDLGDFLVSQRDDTPAALECFEAAADLARDQLEDAYIGMLDCYQALEDKEGLAQLIEECNRLFPDSDRIREAIEDCTAEE